MKIFRSVLTALLSSSAVHGWSSLTSTRQRSSPTRLFISSWGTKGSPYTSTAETAINPIENIQSYLAEPGAVEARDNVDGTVLVSGCANAQDRTDQFIFDLLNHEESAFEFDKIVAYVKDSKFSKKRLLGRSARYTGLLDKLDFKEGESVLPTAEQLEGVRSWIAVIEEDHLSTLEQVAELATSLEGLENVAILLTGATDLDAAASKEILDKFPHAFNPEAPSDDDEEAEIPPTTFTVVAVGTLDEDTPDGRCYYKYREIGSDEGVIPSDSVFPREESYRLITELLQLDCGRQQALSFAQVYNPNITEAKLIKGLRGAGYARPQEIDHMIRTGPKAYEEFVEEWKKENPDAEKGYTSDVWWEQDIYKEARERTAARDAEKAQVVVDKRTKEIEVIAKEWVKREYYRQSMAGTVDETTTEDEFTEQVWDRAVFEADLKYRQMKGEEPKTDELSDFKARQERKQETMLKRAKQELAELLNEDPDKLILPADDDEDDDKKDD